MRVSFAVQAVSALFALTGLVTALVWVTLNAPLADRALLALFLLFSGGVTLAVGYLVPRYGLGQVVRTVRGKLLFALILAVALALVNVGFTLISCSSPRMTWDCWWRCYFSRWAFRSFWH